MSKKLVLMLLVLFLLPAVLFAAGAKEEKKAAEPTKTTTAAPSKYKEAPELTALVEAGELPPVDQRLPEEPMVQFVYGENGKYGGDLKRIDNVYPEDFHIVTRWYFPRIMMFTADAQEMYVNFAREVEVSDDYSEITVHLREGTKWSDGNPVTTEDFVFWWEDRRKYFPEAGRKVEDLVPSMYVVGGKAMELEPIDDYTFKLKFAGSYPLYWSILTRGWNSVEPLPKHYLAEFHPKYATGDKSAAEQWAIFEDKVTHPNGKFIDFPTLNPWVTKDKIQGQRLIQKRNPYYWKVDSDGQQLPYMDGIVTDYLSDQELILMRIGAGEIDLSILSVPRDRVIWQWQEKGDYTINWWKYALWNMWLENLNYYDVCPDEDKEIAALIREKDFRQALSLSLDSDYWGEVYGLGAVQQGFQYMDPTKVHTKRMKEQGLWDKYMNMYGYYDIEKANSLLDELGLERRDDGWRYFESGNRVEITILTSTDHDTGEQQPKIAEDVEKNIGVKVWIQAQAWPATLEIYRTNQYQFFGFQQGSRSPWIEIDPSVGKVWPEYSKWDKSSGQEGIEPDDPNWSKLADLRATLGKTADMDKRIDLGIEATNVIMDSGWTIIRFWADMGFPGVFTNRLGNVPQEITADDYFQGWPIAINIEQIYIKY